MLDEAASPFQAFLIVKQLETKDSRQWITVALERCSAGLYYSIILTLFARNDDIDKGK